MNSAKKPLNVVGGQIRVIRNRLELSQADLARKCQLLGYNISRESLAKIESRLRGIGDYEMIGIAEALKVSVESLFPKSGHLKLARECFRE